MNKNLSPYMCHGIDFVETMGEENIAQCPFCSKRNHFYVNGSTGQYSCKHCDAHGNVYTFLKNYSDMIYEETSITDYKRLRKLRGLTVQALRDWKLGWDGANWLLPVLSEKKTCLDIRRWNSHTGIAKSTAGCKSQLYGWYRAAGATTIWLCEGEWDAIAMSWILAKTNSSARACGVPGAMTFKDSWIERFQGKNVIIVYDNDPPGEQGTLKVYEALKNVAKSILILKWPANFPKGYDIRDFVKDRLKAGFTYKEILKKLKKYSTNPEEHTLIDAAHKKKKKRKVISVPDFKQMLSVYKRHADMKPDLVNALRIMFAVVLSAHEAREPLWIYIVGPSGGGKTMLLESFDNNPNCIYESTISAHGLVSGFKRKDDPSLLPRLRGKCLIWKDFTELLTKKAYDKPEIYSTLRGAYDGNVRKTFGNGITREYHNLYFSMLAGVTPAIHGDKQAMMGERFLKYELFKNIESSADEQIKAALAQSSEDEEKRVEVMQRIAKRFLARKIYVPRVSGWIEERLIALVQLISRIRTSAEREQYGDRDVLYKPSVEIGTRLAKQLLKLSKFLAVVDGEKVVNYKQWRLAERVAFDTSDKMHLEIVHTIGKNKMEIKAIVSGIGLSYSNIRRQLEDMQLARVVEKSGAKPVRWGLTEQILDLWTRAKIGDFDDK